MPRTLHVLFGLCLFLACNAASGASAQVDPVVRVVAASQVGDVTLRYRLPAPVSRFEFAETDIVRTLWSVTTPGLTMADGVISGAAPFDAFELRLRPDAAEVDRVYPGLSRIGDGWVLYGPGLKAKDAATALAFELAPGEVSLPAVNALDGYAYVGPSARVAPTDGGDVVTGADVDPDLANPLRRTFFEAMAFYQTRLGSPLPFRPAVFVSVDSPGPTTFRGDVTDNGAISLRFLGDTWRQTGDQLVTFLWHETFHLWNGHGVRNRDARSAPWLHEGGADYAAVVGAVSMGDFTELQGRAALTRRINSCRSALGDRDMDPARLRSGSAPYGCGVLIQWLADLELRRDGSDVLSLWNTVLAGAHDAPDGYGVREFRAGLKSDSAVNILLDSPGSDRWRIIHDRLAALGVTIEDRPGDEDLRAAALFHVADRNCKGGSYGYNDTPGALTLEGSDCGVLSGDPIIDKVEGFDPQKETRAMFDAVQTRCATGASIRYATRDGRVLEAVCDRPLVRPTIWFVADAPALALQSTPPVRQ